MTAAHAHSDDQSALTQRDLEKMQRALEQARAARDMGEAPIGAVVYETHTGRMLSQAHNRREIDADPTAHAEILALREAARRVGDWRLSRCTLAVTLEPCAMCAGAIVNARVGRLIYGADDPKAGGVRSLYQLCEDARLNHRCIVISGALADESAALLTSFFRDRRG